jgi:DNA-directed RNA polymerase subunit beta'
MERSTLSEVRSFFEKPKPLNDFNAIRLGLASPEKIRSWSHGEVIKPETINYRTFKPERDGLFCAKIFGPVTDWECLCGKYKRMKYRGVVCDKCGVEVTKSKVRRERMGHIELAAPVSHVWFFKGLPSRIGLLLDMTMRELERVLYFEAYVVIDAGDTPLEERQILSEEEYREGREEYGEAFVAQMGAEAIRDLLERLDLDDMAAELRMVMRTETAIMRRQKAAKRLKLVEAFRRSGNRPEWMILEVIPVLPPELRPLVPLDGGRFATSDLNDLYRRVINRNNRLKKLLDLRAPEVIVRNEKRMLQEAVDALFDNGRRGRVIKGSNNRPLKSLSDNLKGKQGRFRQNLLGKRVDYSGRSVIVVGPELRLNQCGLPKKMALELFKPFVYQELETRELASTIKMAKELVDLQTPEVWDALEKVIGEHPVLLNRAPTLHRLGIQAFEPRLVEGKAIKIHPLVCAAYNADFDGDQMAVHVPLSPKAQLEAHILMMSSRNILSPASGRPLAVPSQDMVIGVYYLTTENYMARGAGKTFSSAEEVFLAHNAGVVATQAPVQLRYSGPLIDLVAQGSSQDLLHADMIEVSNMLLETTVGRVLFNMQLPADMPFINGQLKKKGLQNLVAHSFMNLGHDATIELLDNLKEIGFGYATKSGLSLASQDMIIPDAKQEHLDQAYREVDEVERQRSAGLITAGERHNKIVDIWHRVTEDVAREMFLQMSQLDDETGEFNPIFMMADSGARGSKEQVRQLAGMRGLMAKPSGEIMETPITANFREGLSVLQYFISTHGARKGLADTALKTADSGYLTRRLVDVAQDVIVVEHDCGTEDGIEVIAITEGGEILEELRDRIVGRVSAEDIYDPLEGSLICAMNTEISEALANQIQEAGIERVRIRSVLTCETERGVCQLCYGRMLATGRMVEIGEAVGIIAAQSIGEPGTQLTMRTFHYGGTATRGGDQSQHVANHAGKVKFLNVSMVVNKDGHLVAISRTGKLVILDERQREKERYSVAYGSHLLVEDDQDVESGTPLVAWDPFTSSILTAVKGKVKFIDLVEGENVREEIDKLTGHAHKIVIEPLGSGKRIPTIVVKGRKKDEERRYQLPIGSHLTVAEGNQLAAGDVLAKIPREMSKTKDITGGLPRVVELFEARKPKDPAVVTEIDGIAKITEPVRGQRRIVVKGEGDEHREYSIPRYAHVSVQEGEFIQAGDPLTEGSVNPHDILSILGETEMQRHLVDKIQEVYRSQGVTINDKHIEVMVRQMMRFVKVVDPGDTDFLLDQQIPRYLFERENERVVAAGGEAATAKSLLLGITKASLATESFISAASFQETTRVLTEAAVSGKVDNLHGLKENVIVGRLIPAGTGAPRYRRTVIEPAAADELEPQDDADVLYQEMTEAAAALIESQGDQPLSEKS